MFRSPQAKGVKKARLEAARESRVEEIGDLVAKSIQRANSSVDLESSGRSTKERKISKVDKPGFHKNFNLQALGIPQEAWPQKGKNPGKFGYTVTSANGAVALPDLAGV